MKCFVTGGTGHIGNVLIKKLVKLGHSVRALVLPNEDTTPIKDLPITLVTGDVTDREFLFNTIEEDEVVFHLAGVIEIAPGRDEIVRKVNVDGTKNIVDVCVEKKLRLVYTSSVHTITPVNDVVLYEPTAFDLDKLVGTYAKTKAEAVKKQESELIFIFDSLFADMRYRLANIKFYFNHDLTDNIVLRGLPAAVRRSRWSGRWPRCPHTGSPASPRRCGPECSFLRRTVRRWPPG